jgi:hypothetical protein
MKSILQACARRLGYQFVRVDSLRQLHGQLESVNNDLTGYKAALEQTTTDLTGYKRALEQTSGQLAGYRSAFEQTERELNRYRRFLQESVRVNNVVQPLGFLHIQKTGGISLLQFLGQKFPEWRTLWVFSPRELVHHHPRVLSHFDFICGHFSANNVGQITPGRSLCTLLRHPVDRVLSCYWYFRTYSGAPRDIIDVGVATAKRRSLIAFLRDEHPEVRFHVANHQTHALAGDWTAPTNLASELETAIHNLETFTCVGISERMEESVDLLCRHMGWQRGGPLDRLNQTPYRQAVGEISREEYELIVHLNELDMVLYERARQRLEKDLASAAISLRAA